MGLFSSSKSPAPSTTITDTDGPSLREPILVPSATSPPSKPSELAPHESSKVKAVIEHFNTTDYVLPAKLTDLKIYWASRAANSAAKSGSLTPLSDKEKFWLTNEQIQRCLRAVKWDLKKGIERAEEILVWRRDYGVEDIKVEDIEIESRTGKQYLYGFDKQCRPLLQGYMHPARQNTAVSPRRIKHVVYTMERAIDLMPIDVEKICLCIDLGIGASKGKREPTPISLARETLNILQTYYCERLGRAICADVPFVFWAFFRIMSPFIDPVTKDKVRFPREPQEVKEMIDEPNLTAKEFGAPVDLNYNAHESFYFAVDKFCQEQRQKRFTRWMTVCGGQIGASERVIKETTVEST